MGVVCLGFVIVLFSNLVHHWVILAWFRTETCLLYIFSKIIKRKILFVYFENTGSVWKFQNIVRKIFAIYMWSKIKFILILFCISWKNSHLISINKQPFLFFEKYSIFKKYFLNLKIDLKAECYLQNAISYLHFFEKLSFYLSGSINIPYYHLFQIFFLRKTLKSLWKVMVAPVAIFVWFS